MAHSCFNRPPTFQNAEFRGWLSAIGANLTDTSNVESYTAYRTLRAMFAMKDAKREEMQLFRLAQDSLVHRAPSRSLRVIGQLYGPISLYGTSVTRPIIVLVLSNAACYFVYFTFGLLRTRPLTEPASVAAAHLLEQIFSPFSLWRKQNEPTWVDSGLLWLQILSCVQSLLTLTALALLSIALHWRFRKA